MNNLVVKLAEWLLIARLNIFTLDEIKLLIFGIQL